MTTYDVVSHGEPGLSSLSLRLDHDSAVRQAVEEMDRGAEVTVRWADGSHTGVLTAEVLRRRFKAMQSPFYGRAHRARLNPGRLP